MSVQFVSSLSDVCQQDCQFCIINKCYVELIVRIYLTDICRNSISSGNQGVPICENLFAAIDPTCQRELASSTTSSGGTDGRQERLASTKSAVQPVVPADINVARRRAPLGTFLCILAVIVSTWVPVQSIAWKDLSPTGIIWDVKPSSLTQFCCTFRCCLLIKCVTFCNLTVSFVSVFQKSMFWDILLN